MTHTNHKEWLTLPVSVVIAGALIAASIYAGAREIASQGPTQPAAAAAAQAGSGLKFAQITANDHIRGNLGAKVTIIEYTDLECPFCKVFHANMKTAIAKFSPNDVAWVYRAFPLPSHPKAWKEAEAAECAAELGGNAKFWAFVDRVFEVTPGNNGLDAAELPKIAAYVGLDTESFQKCLDSGKYKAKVQSAIDDGKGAGAAGTPYSLIITKNGGVTPLKGAASVETIEAKIQEALGKK